MPNSLRGVCHLITIISVVEAILIVIALSMDAFVSGFAYGANKIRMPISSVTVISFICTAILAVSLFLGGLIGPFLPDHLAVSVGFLLLFGLGMFKLFDSVIKSYIRRHAAFRKKFRFSLFHLGFILNIYADPEEADSDHSMSLSPSEAAYLAVALSLDGLAVGVGAGMSDANPILIVAFSLIGTVLAVLLGCLLGRQIARKLRFDLSWLSGALLILLAFFKFA